MKKVIKYPYGAVHGRFQPFHNDHLRYCLSAKTHCEFLWVGLAQYDIRCLEHSPNDQHRGLEANNPLTYYERVQIISASLIDSGLDRNEFGFTPFPIDRQEKLLDFIPISIPIFTTINDEWNKYKIKILCYLGYKVIILWESPKKYEGYNIRNKIFKGDVSWQYQVPPKVAELLENLKIRERLMRIHNNKK